MAKTKTCVICKRRRALKFFNLARSRQDGLQPACKTCNAARSRDYYRRNREKHIKDVGRDKRRYIERNRQVALEHLFANPCIDCGETRPIRLDFDHVSGDKKATISRLVTQGVGLKQLQAEIAKCVVRCAGCHREKTAVELGWWIVEELKRRGL